MYYVPGEMFSSADVTREALSAAETFFFFNPVYSHISAKYTPKRVPFSAVIHAFALYFPPPEEDALAVLDIMRRWGPSAIQFPEARHIVVLTIAIHRNEQEP